MRCPKCAICCYEGTVLLTLFSAMLLMKWLCAITNIMIILKGISGKQVMMM